MANIPDSPRAQTRWLDDHSKALGGLETRLLGVQEKVMGLEGAAAAPPVMSAGGAMSAGAVAPLEAAPVGTVAAVSLANKAAAAPKKELKKGERRSSVQMMMESLTDGCESGEFVTQGKGEKEKQTFDEWAAFNTVSFRKDTEKDAMLFRTDENTDWSTWFTIESAPWFISCLVGVLTAMSGAFIEHVVEYFGNGRFGTLWGACLVLPEGVTQEQCDTGYYDGGPDGYMMKMYGYIALSTALAFISAAMTFKFAPMARGSGIPEIKTILGGFTMPQVLECNTLVIKILGLGLSVAAGLSCGKEGPLVHIACCWCNVICNCTARYSKNEGKKRELLSCACASGVAVAFGAPLGGTLFSLEEASTYFPMKTMLKAFTGAAVSAWTLEICHTNPKTGVGYLTMFNANYQVGPGLFEYPFFVFIGISGGCIGAVFVHYNIMIAKGRAPGSPWRKKLHIALEVGIISFLTAVTSYPNLWTRVISNSAIRAMFHNCANVPGQGVDPHAYMLDLCNPDDPSQPNLSMEICWGLLVAGVLRFVQMTFTFGCGAPSGLFIPSLYAGAALGRVFGIGVWLLNLKCDGGCFAPIVYPGIYSMMGAAAVLGGVCRVTISLVVIMFELTSGLQLIVPFMIVCILAKYSGDVFTPGIYDYCITIRKYPFLHEPDDVMFTTSAADLIDEDLEMLTPNLGTVYDFQKMLERAKYGGYPVVQSLEDPIFLGYIFTEAVKDYLALQCKNNVMINNTTRIIVGRYVESIPAGVFDLTADAALNLVDESVITVTMETKADMVHKLFRQMGNKVIIVKKEGYVAGLITKKSFIRHMEKLHAAHAEGAPPPAEAAAKAAPGKAGRRASVLKAAS